MSPTLRNALRGVPVDLWSPIVENHRQGNLAVQQAQGKQDRSATIKSEAAESPVIKTEPAAIPGIKDKPTTPTGLKSAPATPRTSLWSIEQAPASKIGVEPKATPEFKIEKATPDLLKFEPSNLSAISDSPASIDPPQYGMKKLFPSISKAAIPAVKSKLNLNRRVKHVKALVTRKSDKKTPLRKLCTKCYKRCGAATWEPCHANRSNSNKLQTPAALKEIEVDALFLQTKYATPYVCCKIKLQSAWYAKMEKASRADGIFDFHDADEATVDEMVADDWEMKT
jgi:hypothetical protein